MNNKEITRIDIVEGGSIIRQGHYFTMHLKARNSKGVTVDLTGKDILVQLIGSSGIVYESAGRFENEEILFDVQETLPHGTLWMEITATDPNDETYRQKFPSARDTRMIKMVRGADDLEVSGIAMKTVKQFEDDQAAFKAEIKQEFDAAVGAITEDAEVILARGDEPTLYQRLDKDKQEVAVKLAETSSTVIKQGFQTRFNKMNDISLTNFKITDTRDSVPLNIVSPYGGAEFVHPDVFYAPNGWNGYKYWMAVNPYKNQIESYENPSLYVSQDGILYIPAPGVSNPMEPFPGSPTHYSDPCLLLDKNGYTLHYIHRQSGAGTDNIFWLMSSDNGRDWTKQIEIYRSVGREIVNPEIVFDGNDYHMYFMDVSSFPYLLKRTTSKDLLNWSDEITCTITGTSWYIWHFDLLQYGGGYLMCAMNNGHNKNMILKSHDGLNFQMVSEDFLTSEAAKTTVGLYKPSINFYENGGREYLLLYYNTKGDTVTGGEDYLLRRLLVPLDADRDNSYSNYIPKLAYMNGLNVEGYAVTGTQTNGYYSSVGALTHFQFRIDITSIAGESGRALTIELPTPPKPFGSQSVFLLDYNGQSPTVSNIYGVLDSLTGKIHLKNGRVLNSANTPLMISDISGITSLRGTVTYFNNASQPKRYDKPI